jgi:alpha-L-arabinofuranosidase
MKTRREWLERTAAIPAALILGPHSQAESNASVIINPAPLFDISPHLYMQFMEPLGSTDSSVEAAWDYTRDEWRRDFVETVRDLSPGAIRFGGNFSRYYKWREGVGPVNRRPWMRNYDWGGKETNRVGTHEFVSFCRQVGADPFYCVNFESDGIQSFRRTPEGDRTGSAQEAADWVSYANDPDSRERKANGFPEPYNIKLWQIGNETSYAKEAFSKQQAITRTVEFAKAMRERDPDIQLIGWGDKGRGSDQLWAGDLLQQAGDIAASRANDRIFLHVLNMDCHHSVDAAFAVLGREAVSGHVRYIAPSNLRAYVNQDERETFKPVEKVVPQSSPLKWRFPAASVSVVELAMKPE